MKSNIVSTIQNPKTVQSKSEVTKHVSNKMSNGTFSIKSQWAYGFQGSDLVVFSFLIWKTISCVNQTYRNTFQGSVMTFALKMLIKMMLHATFISLKFPLIVLVIFLPKLKCICCFSYILFFANFTF